MQEVESMATITATPEATLEVKSTARSRVKSAIEPVVEPVLESTVEPTIEPKAKLGTVTVQTRSTELPPKMSVMGVGGKIAIPTLLYLAVAETISRTFRPRFRIT